MKTPRLSLLAPLAVGLLAMVFQLLFINYPISRSDNIYSLMGAWSLWQGWGYSDISTPLHAPLLKYPPLISWPMVPWAAAFGPGLKWYRLSNVLLVPIELIVVFLLLEPRFKRGALLVIALLGIHFMSLWGHFVFGTTFYALAVWMSIYAILKLDALKSASAVGQEGRFQKRALWWSMGLSLSLAIGFYSHRMALALIATAGIYLWFKHSPGRALTVMGLCFMLCAPWLVRSYSYSGKWLSPEYEGEVHGRFLSAAPEASLPVAAVYYFAEQARQLPPNFAIAMLPWNELNLARHLGSLRIPLQVTTIGIVTFFLVLGWILSWREEFSFAEWYVAVHLLMVCLFIANVAYFLVLFPFLMWYLVRGMKWTGSKIGLSPSSLSRVLVVGAAVQFSVLLVRDKVYFDQMGWPGTNERDPRWNWVQDIVPRGKTVFWLGLPAYAWAPWRFFDSGRYALGEPNVFAGYSTSNTNFFKSKQPLCDFVAAPSARHDWQEQLLQRGWRPIYRENLRTSDAVTLFTRP
jgi:hypothetical protein